MVGATVAEMAGTVQLQLVAVVRYAFDSCPAEQGANQRKGKDGFYIHITSLLWQLHLEPSSLNQ